MLSNNVFATAKEHVLPSLLDNSAEQHSFYQTPTGLGYRVIEQGQGDKPSWDATVTVHQRVTLTNGRVLFDTRKQGVAVEYEIAEAIVGLQEALQLMNKGSRFEVLVPAHLARDVYSAFIEEKHQQGCQSPMLVDITLVDFS
ncbi:MULTISPECIES: FKBP-type peptidyl-prolyl cis-trans isomerase [Pseudoalteromonas]|uniref:Peptidyl-prolyl cis-trans isomerase n=1 Tax=Pseudoalteromonas lipolytica TaxID=570156 RepID=A0ABU8SQ24_9GAMM|nr:MULTISPECIES: FKBP-type peptidyl-prolyl cis-trans isomerase [unclassified Pseudoalteromonas]MCF2917259.1 FKBP-type peptidyl-prolyl cis-trans isomerase [Pseudoalteromonas sp. Cn5-37]MCH2088145.1 FKBP-type peptidyl-prolyl cis-trans isomerase [Pseudoalteromonas sp.]|tara:strand:- start:518 stop:943 length:426 start_codon:yes stop_codon:yes gene_type:complete